MRLFFLVQFLNQFGLSVLLLRISYYDRFLFKINTIENYNYIFLNNHGNKIIAFIIEVHIYKNPCLMLTSEKFR